MQKIISSLVVFVIGSIAMFNATAQDNNWIPNSSVKIIVPFGVGGTSDGIVRALADRLSNEIKQPVVILNLGGAGGTIGTRAIAEAPNNGLTLGIGTGSTLGTSPIFFKNLAYNTEKDIRSVITLADSPRAMVVRSDLPVKNVKDLIKLTNSNPNKYFYGAILNGADYLVAESFKTQSNADLTFVPYNNGSELALGLGTNSVQVVFDNLFGHLGQVRSGSVRLMAISWHERLKEFPDVPTWNELGYKGINFGGWYNISVPASTPDHIVRYWNKIFQEVLKDPKVKAALSNQNVEIISNTPKGADKLAADTLAAYRKIAASLETNKR